MIKKYRAVFIVGASLIFNLLTSIAFAENGVYFNLKPLSIGEWICDIISNIGFIFGIMLMSYDIFSYKPVKKTIYKRVNGEVVEIIIEE